MLALFGFCMALFYDAPWYIWVIGFFCFMMDGNTGIRLEQENKKLREAIEICRKEMESRGLLGEANFILRQREIAKGE